MSYEFEAEFFSRLLARYRVRPFRILVIGCGSGREPGTLAGRLRAEVVGIDLRYERRRQPAAGAFLVQGDAGTLCFRDGVFDAVYCFHVMEHVLAPVRAVCEMFRVLRPGGVAFVGTPNKGRLVGYLGGRATLWQKVAWNCQDLWMRVRGRWANQMGAHAGFQPQELTALLGSAFGCVEPVSHLYYLSKYNRWAGILGRIVNQPSLSFIFPSVYCAALKEEVRSPATEVPNGPFLT